MKQQLEADLSAIEAALKAGPADGPWELWSSCSWLRINTLRGTPVIVPTNDVDGHPNLIATRETLGYVIACEPARMARLTESVRVLLAEQACMRAQLEALRGAVHSAAAQAVTVVEPTSRCVVTTAGVGQPGVDRGEA